MGEHEKAGEHFEAASKFESDAGLMPSLALTKLWWARSLLARGRAADEEHARSLLAASIELSREQGYARYLEWAEALLAERLST
jgi:hypothetical protein